MCETCGPGSDAVIHFSSEVEAILSVVLAEGAEREEATGSPFLDRPDTTTAERIAKLKTLTTLP